VFSAVLDLDLAPINFWIENVCTEFFITVQDLKIIDISDPSFVLTVQYILLYTPSFMIPHKE
jgi:hypothetical protein